MIRVQKKFSGKNAANAHAELQIAAPAIGGLRVIFFADVRAGAGRGIAGDHRPQRTIKSVMRVGEPIVAPRARDDPIPPEPNPHSGVDGLQIFPGKLIGQAKMIVDIGIERIEGVSHPVVRVAVTGGVIVFGEKTRPVAELIECVARYAKPAARTNVIAAQMTCLYGAFRVVVPGFVNCTRQAQAHDFLIEIAGDALFVLLIRREPPEQEGLDQTAWQDGLQFAVESIEVVSGLMMRKAIVGSENRRRRERGCRHRAPVGHGLDGVVAFRRVPPIRRSEQPAIFEVQILASGAQGEMALGHVAEIYIAAAEVPGFLIRRRERLSFSEGVSVLKLSVNLKPRSGRDQHSETETREEIRIRGMRLEIGAAVALIASAIAERQTKPTREIPIHFRHRGERSLGRIGVRRAVGVDLAAARIIHNALGHYGAGKRQKNEKEFLQSLTRITWGLTCPRNACYFCSMCWFCSRRLRIALGLAACGPAFGQNTACKLEFEAASVKRSQLPAHGRVLVGGRGGPGSADPGGVAYSFMPLKWLLAIAYRVKQHQISGPGWLETERYDIVATIPGGTSKAQFPIMLQTLLTARFGIELHHETRELPLYELSVAKNGPKLKPPAADPNARGASRMSLTPGGFHLEEHTEPASHLAVILEDQLASPVVDKTGGTFDFTLDFSRESVQNSALARLPPPPPANPLGPVAAPAGDPTEAPSLFTAVQEQLGLKLDKKRGPLDVIVLDRAEKVPKED